MSKEILFKVNYLADHTHSGIIHRVVVFDTPYEVYKIIPIKGLKLPGGGLCKHFEFAFKRKKFDFSFYG